MLHLIFLFYITHFAVSFIAYILLDYEFCSIINWKSLSALLIKSYYNFKFCPMNSSYSNKLCKLVKKKNQNWRKRNISSVFFFFYTCKSKSVRNYYAYYSLFTLSSQTANHIIFIVHLPFPSLRYDLRDKVIKVKSHASPRHCIPSGQQNPNLPRGTDPSLSLFPSLPSSLCVSLRSLSLPSFLGWPQGNLWCWLTEPRFE